MRNLCIVGTGSQARYVIETITVSKAFKIAGLVDLEDASRIGKYINGYKIQCILDNIHGCFPPSECEIVVAYGNNKKKKEVAEYLQDSGYSFATIIHPTAYVAEFVEIGKGCILNPSVTILPNVTIGNHVIIHSGSVIEHDNKLEDYVNVAPGVSTGGHVKVGEGTYVYTGAVIIPQINIGEWAVIGAGAVIRENVRDDDVVVGVPGRSIKH